MVVSFVVDKVVLRVTSDIFDTKYHPLVLLTFANMDVE